MTAKHQQWSAHIAAWTTSGLSASAWCRQHDVSMSSLSYWRRKLGVPPMAPPLPGSLPIQVAPSAVSPRMDIHLRGGTRLSIAVSDPAWLANLLQRLDAC